MIPGSRPGRPSLKVGLLEEAMKSWYWAVRAVAVEGVGNVRGQVPVAILCALRTSFLAELAFQESGTRRYGPQFIGL